MTLTEQAQIVTLTSSDLIHGFNQRLRVQIENKYKLMNVTNITDMNEVVITTKSD